MVGAVERTRLPRMVLTCLKVQNVLSGERRARRRAMACPFGLEKTTWTLSSDSGFAVTDRVTQAIYLVQPMTRFVPGVTCRCTGVTSGGWA